MCGWRLWVLAALLPLAAAMLPKASRNPGPGPSGSLNQTGSPASLSNGTATAMDSVVPILRHFLTLRNLVLAASAGAFLLVVCLLARVFRCGTRLGQMGLETGASGHCYCVPAAVHPLFLFGNGKLCSDSLHSFFAGEE
ncbi:hypothetical protein chiPu_0023986 [Chiloscyllium punctatum]|uniref:Uncharacterized protein n=1 Tax=Chiloscyllium punctatum TaxID=137246 RepID=A0A401TCE9_CHIPU|nr:hypothetical protein [Chiloscyllium punctatum]